MKFSYKEIRSRFDRRFIQISPMGWVESHEHLIGRLLSDSSTGKMYLKGCIFRIDRLKTYRMGFLNKFRYTQQLCWYNPYLDAFGYVVELHGFIKDM